MPQTIFIVIDGCAVKKCVQAILCALIETNYAYNRQVTHSDINTLFFP